MADNKTTEKSTAPEAKSKKDERVELLIPFVEGEDPEWTCGINGKMYKVQKGKRVLVPRAVMKVYENSSSQEMTAALNRERLKEVEL